MSFSFQLIGKVYPKPEHLQTVLDALEVFAEHVKTAEPNCLQYESFRQTNAEEGTECLVYIETYTDKAAFEAHSNGEEMQALIKRAVEEELLAKATEHIFIEKTGGFSSRS